jgi:tRNA nucleotidyltransferase/poly(A) polymerase
MADTSPPTLPEGEHAPVTLDLAAYRGCWVALVGDQVAGVGATAEAAQLAAHRSRPRERISATRWVPDDQLAMNHVALPTGFLDLSKLEDTFAGQVLQRLRALVDPLVLVGGTVRDVLLGRELHDLDLAAPAGGLDLARRLADAMHGAYVPLDVARDTGRAVLTSPQGQSLFVDFAAWRGPSLADDLRKRDFTINALAAEVHGASAQLIDVTGGLADLENRLLRTASQQALREDPLRCLRAVRLLAELSPWRFRLEQDTAGQIRRHAPLVAGSASERVRDELVRTLAAPEPQRWLGLLSDLGLLAVVLPEAEALHDVAQTAPHIYDVFEHTAQVVDYAARLAGWITGQGEPADALDAAASQALAPMQPALVDHLAERVGVSLGSRSRALSWAALCHDWGKPATRAVEVDPHSGQARTRFLGHEDVSAALAGDALRRLRFSEAEVRWVTTIVAGHMRPHHLAAAGQPSRRAVYRYFRDLGAAGVDTALLSLADLYATGAPEQDLSGWQRQLDLVVRLLDDYFNRPQEAVRPAPLIDGHDLQAALGLRPGRLIGQLLETVAEAQAAGELHSRDQALAYAAQMAEAPEGLERG